METNNESIFRLELNDGNPRLIKDERFGKLVNSILVFPNMLKLRPIVVDENDIALGGNMRLRALREIARMTMDDIRQRFSNIKGFGDKDEREQAELLSYWESWLNDKTVPTTHALNLSENEKREFIIKDNVSFGEWDWDTLANDWDNSELLDWGLHVWDNVDFDDSDIYTVKQPEEKERELVTVELTGDALSHVQEITDVISKAIVNYKGARIR